MKALVEGHLYHLDSFEEDLVKGETLQFIQKEKNEAGELVTVQNGTTNEEVLAVLIDRMNYLQSKFPCRENAIAITNLEQALMWLNKRTQDRVNRGVEGKCEK